MKTLRSFTLFAVALVAFGVLAVVMRTEAPSAAARIAHLESIVRCPSCEDLSVAQSNATSAIAVRHQIAREVRDGRSDQQILSGIEGVYGTQILLSPKASGLGLLLYVVPLALAVGLVLLVWRLRRR